MRRINTRIRYALCATFPNPKPRCCPPTTRRVLQSSRRRPPRRHSLILEPSVPIPRHRRRIRLMPQERTTPAPLPPHGRSFVVTAGAGGVEGEVPALVVVSFYRFADFPDHAALRWPLKELCEELVVIDVRNMYEIRIGKFKRAVDPSTNSFREFPSWVNDQFKLAESGSQ